jgi:hypothetical protein
MASCAPCDGVQNDPLEVYPCGHDPPGPAGFGSGKGSASAEASHMFSTTTISSVMHASMNAPRRSNDLAVVIASSPSCGGVSGVC